MKINDKYTQKIFIIGLLIILIGCLIIFLIIALKFSSINSSYGDFKEGVRNYQSCFSD